MKERDTKHALMTSTKLKVRTSIHFSCECTVNFQAPRPSQMNPWSNQLEVPEALLSVPKPKRKTS